MHPGVRAVNSQRYKILAYEKMIAGQDAPRGGKEAAHLSGCCDEPVCLHLRFKAIYGKDKLGPFPFTVKTQFLKN